MNNLFHTIFGVKSHFGCDSSPKEFMENNAPNDFLYWGKPYDYNGIEVPGIILLVNKDTALYEKGYYAILSFVSYEKNKQYDYSGEGYAFCIIQVKAGKETNRAYRTDVNIAARMFEEFEADAAKEADLVHFAEIWETSGKLDNSFTLSALNEKSAWEYLCFFFYKEMKQYFEENYFDSFKLYKVYNTTETPFLLVDTDGNVSLSLQYANIPLLSEVVKTIFKDKVSFKTAEESEVESKSETESETESESKTGVTVFEKEFKELDSSEQKSVIKKLERLVFCFEMEEEVIEELKKLPFEAPADMVQNKAFWSDIVIKYIAIFEAEGKKNVIDAVMLTMNEWMSRSNNINYQKIFCPYTDDDVRAEVEIVDLWNGKERKFVLSKKEVLIFKPRLERIHAGELS